MPDGASGEWKTFWEAPGLELESKNGIPLLWWCLFSQGDIAHARLIDDFDAGDTEGERESFVEDSGYSAETRYPYLITSVEAALTRLRERRSVMLEGIGDRYAPIYDEFMILIKDHFRPFVLVRTSGLPDIPEAEQWIRDTAIEMDHLGHQPGPAVQSMITNFKRWSKNDPVWLRARRSSYAKQP
ncbi:hypothetical protein ACVWZA_003659 [Sphingomonas sp. UYAg733]